MCNTVLMVSYSIYPLHFAVSEVPKFQVAKARAKVEVLVLTVK